jgi:alpha-L-fucosidase 2
MHPGRASAVTVTLTAGGTQTLPSTRLSLQLPQGWTATPATKVFATIPPGTAMTGTFRVTPPRYSPDITAVVHATATMGAMQREAGTSISIHN